MLSGFKKRTDALADGAAATLLYVAVVSGATTFIFDLPLVLGRYRARAD
jgi:hypothetical protein